MESIFKIIGTLCLCGYITGLLMNFTTVTYTQKAVRLVCALYIITTVIMPIGTADFDFSAEEFAEKSALQQQAEEYVLSTAEDNMENDIKNLLDVKNISYTQLNVHINKQKDSLAVGSVEIYGINTSDRQKVIQLLENTVSQDKILFGD